MPFTSPHCETQTLLVTRFGVRYWKWHLPTMSDHWLTLSLLSAPPCHIAKFDVHNRFHEGNDGNDSILSGPKVLHQRHLCPSTILVHGLHGQATARASGDSRSLFFEMPVICRGDYYKALSRLLRVWCWENSRQIPTIHGVERCKDSTWFLLTGPILVLERRKRSCVPQFLERWCMTDRPWRTETADTDGWWHHWIVPQRLRGTWCLFSMLKSQESWTRNRSWWSPDREVDSGIVQHSRATTEKAVYCVETHKSHRRKSMEVQFTPGEEPLELEMWFETVRSNWKQSLCHWELTMSRRWKVKNLKELNLLRSLPPEFET